MKQQPSDEFQCELLGNLCDNCVVDLPPFYCCYQTQSKNECLSKANSCLGSSICPKISKEKTSLLLSVSRQQLRDRVNSFNPRVETKLNESFIPEILPVGEETNNALQIIREVDCNSIVVSLKRFFTRSLQITKHLRTARKSGIHSFLEYEGQIILSLDVPDPLCDYFLRKREMLQRVLLDLSPDVVTLLDTYTYRTRPAVLSEIKMHQVMTANCEVFNIPVPVVGMLLGATFEQLTQSCLYMKSAGIEIVGIPCYELRRDGLTNEIQARVEIVKHFGMRSMLLSCSPGIRYNNKIIGSDHYSSYSWFSGKCLGDNHTEVRKRRIEKNRGLALRYSKLQPLLRSGFQ